MSIKNKQQRINQVSRNASLPHKAFALQIRQNHGLQLFARLRSRNPYASAKLAMPLQPHRPALFCPLSPEAYLLTGRSGKENCGVCDAIKALPFKGGLGGALNQ